MTSGEIKLALLRYFRHERYMVCSTETSLGLGISDVTAYDFKTKLYDVEVKVSWSDFINDFKKLKHKVFEELIKNPHTSMVEMEKRVISPGQIVPTRFYFAVPQKLSARVLEHVKDMHCGVIEVNSKYVVVLKTARKIHNFELPDAKIQRGMLYRMSSEVIARTSALNKKNTKKGNEEND